MRGAISVALVASLPSGNLKNILQTITFGVVLLSLIIQYGDSNNMEILWIGPDGSVNGTHLSYVNRGWLMAPYKLAGRGTSFPGFGASTGFPSDGKI
jgi:hypothetical protein